MKVKTRKTERAVAPNTKKRDKLGNQPFILRLCGNEISVNLSKSLNIPLLSQSRKETSKTFSRARNSKLASTNRELKHKTHIF